MGHLGNRCRYGGLAWCSLQGAPEGATLGTYLALAYINWTRILLGNLEIMTLPAVNDLSAEREAPVLTRIWV